MSDDTTVSYSDPVEVEPPEGIAPHIEGRPVRPPADIGAFRFAVVSALRAAQLLRGCVPKIDDGGSHRATVIAQLEVAGGKIRDIDV
jgi:hypothetical protein